MDTAGNMKCVLWCPRNDKYFMIYDQSKADIFIEHAVFCVTALASFLICDTLFYDFWFSDQYINCSTGKRFAIHVAKQ